MEAMASDDRQPAAAVIDQLADNPAGFDLFQAIRLLERAVPGAQPLGRGHGMGEPVRLRGLVSLAFQPRDIGRVQRPGEGGERGEGGEGGRDAHRYMLATPVMSLAGAGGPLPLAYTELLLERRAARDPAMGDLLDSFNHRFLSFLYRGRGKHVPALGSQRPATGPLADCLDALSNLGLQRGAAADAVADETAGAAPGTPAPWLRHAGLLGPAPRSMAGLLALLGDRLGLRVRGTQFMGGWLPVAAGDAVRLGGRGAVAGTALGGGAVLGQRAWDQAAGIRLDVQLPAAARLQALLPGGNDHALIAGLVRAYAPQPLAVRLALHVGTRAPARLGPGARLGWTTWLAGGGQARPAPVQLALRGGARSPHSLSSR